MKNKKLFRSLAIAVLVFTAMYLLTSFVIGNIDAKFWPENSRLFLAMFGPLFAIIAALLSYNECKE